MGKKNFDDIPIKEKRILPGAKAKDLSSIKKAPPKKEPENKSVSIKLKESEVQILREKAGELVPISTYIKHFLRTETDIFSRSEEKK